VFNDVLGVNMANYWESIILYGTCGVDVDKVLLSDEIVDDIF